MAIVRDNEAQRARVNRRSDEFCTGINTIFKQLFENELEAGIKLSRVDFPLGVRWQLAHARGFT